MGYDSHEMEQETGRLRSRLDLVSIGCLLVSCMVLAAGGFVFWWLV